MNGGNSHLSNSFPPSSVIELYLLKLLTVACLLKKYPIPIPQRWSRDNDGENQLQAQTKYCYADPSPFWAELILPSPVLCTVGKQFFMPVVAEASWSDTSGLKHRQSKGTSSPKKRREEKRKNVGEEEERLREHLCCHPSSLFFYQEKGVYVEIKGFFLKDKEKM